MKKYALLIIACLLAGMLGAFLTVNYLPQSSEKLVSEFYSVENAVHVSPHGLRKKMDHGDQSFILVDLRSAEEYEKEHVAGAVNIPAYKDKDTSDYGAVDRIVGEFAKLPKDKEVIVYCYSTACMTGRKIGLMLSEHGIYVKHLGIGWNEWRYNWNGWNHEGEWNSTNVEDYVISGKEPGVKKGLNNTGGLCSKGEFGC